jgi:hypothetical protein
MESTTCFTCSAPISKGTGKTELSCGHVFHPHCIHSYYKGFSACPVCPQEKGLLLDFGNNVHIANATRETVYAAAQASVPKSSFSWIVDKIKPTGKYPAICGVDDLVQWRAPITEFVNRKITARNLAESGVKLDIWFGCGYTLSDLKTLDVKWDDFVLMGFSPKFVANRQVPASFLVDVLKVDISQLLQVGLGHTELAQAGFTSTELLALKCTTHPLINTGMQPEHMNTFKFSEKEWKILGLSD